jgi:CBS domain-containing protein
MMIAELCARDVMTTDPLMVASHESPAASWEVLARAGCGFMPVLRGGRVVGVIDEGTLRSNIGNRWDDRPRTVAHFSSPAHTVRATTPVPELVARFAANRLTALVVVDDDEGVLGVVTSATLVDLLDEALRAVRDDLPGRAAGLKSTGVSTT